MHIDDIIDTLDAYLISVDKPCTVVEFGASDVPKTPYVVVKQESGSFRVIGHVAPGQQSALRELVRKDFQDALFDISIGSGFRLMLDPLATPEPIINTNDDGSISQERLFLAADRLY
jgi:hypothetical protein